MAYLSIARTAGKLAFNLAVDFDDTLDDVAGLLFEVEIGPWMLLGLGFGVVSVGLVYVYGALTGGYISDFRRQLDVQVARWAAVIGKVGITARGVGFILIGSYLIKAAYLVDDDTAGGLGKVFDQLDSQPLGDYWLGAIAFGFIAYAIYMIVAGLYRRFSPPFPSDTVWQIPTVELANGLRRHPARRGPYCTALDFFEQALELRPNHYYASAAIENVSTDLANQG